jgi:hypothetical protein
VVKRLATIGACCLALSVSVLSGLTVLGQHQQDKANRLAQTNKAVCLAVNANNATLKNLLVYFEARALANPSTTNAQKDAITAFYNDAIQQLPKPTVC